MDLNVTKVFPLCTYLWEKAGISVAIHRHSFNLSGARVFSAGMLEILNMTP